MEGGVEVEHKHLVGDAVVDGLAGFGEEGEGAGYGFVLAAVGEEGAFGGWALVDLLRDGVAKGFDALAGEGGGLDLRGGFWLWGEVDLVADLEIGAAFQGGEEGEVCGVGGFGHEEDEVGGGEGLVGAGDTEGFGFVGSVAEAGGVEKFDGNAVDCGTLGDEVACGAGGRGDDGAVAVEKAIEEG